MNAFSSLILFVFQGLQENSTSRECNVGTYFIFRDIRLKTPQKNFFSEPCNMQEAKKLFFSRQAICRNEIKHFFQALQIAGSKKTFFQSHAICRKQKKLFFGPCRLQRWKKTFFSRQKFPEDEKNIFFPSKVPRGPKKTFFPHTQIPQGRRKIKYTLYNIYSHPKNTPNPTTTPQTSHPNHV